MIRLLASLFPSRAHAAALGDDPLGELLRGARDTDVAPEVLLRIL
jgi:hypothetical protein